MSNLDRIVIVAMLVNINGNIKHWSYWHAYLVVVFIFTVWSVSNWLWRKIYD